MLFIGPQLCGSHLRFDWCRAREHYKSIENIENHRMRTLWATRTRFTKLHLLMRICLVVDRDVNCVLIMGLFRVI